MGCFELVSVFIWPSCVLGWLFVMCSLWQLQSCHEQNYVSHPFVTAGCSCRLIVRLYPQSIKIIIIFLKSSPLQDTFKKIFNWKLWGAFLMEVWIRDFEANEQWCNDNMKVLTLFASFCPVRLERKLISSASFCNLIHSVRALMWGFFILTLLYSGGNFPTSGTS